MLKVEGDKIYGGNNGVSGVQKWAESEIWDDQGKLSSEAKPYTKSKSILKANHPVMIMVSEQRTQLLGHPLCMALVRCKWNSLGRYVYYGTLILYLLFVVLLTNFVLDTPAPYSPYQIIDKSPMTVNGTAEKIVGKMLKKYRAEGYGTEQACLEVESLTGLARHANVLFDKWIIILLAFVFLIKEIFQIFQVCHR